MQRLFRNGHVVFLALDHGFSLGPLPGLEDLSTSVENLSTCPVDAVILNWGAVKSLPLKVFKNDFPPLIVHIAGSETATPSEKFLIADPLQAVLMGADAVSFQINIGEGGNQIREAAMLIEKASRLEMPTLLMIYDARPAISTADKIKKAIRLAIELGADMLKLDINGDFETLSLSSRNAPLPILIAGGGKTESELIFLKEVHKSLDSGAAGVSVGRNVFQSENPANMLLGICDLTHCYGAANH